MYTIFSTYKRLWLDIQPMQMQNDNEFEDDKKNDNEFEDDKQMIMIM